MTNWLIIKDNLVVSILKKVGNILPEDFEGDFDTIQDDPSEKFIVGDIFNLDKWYEYNPMPLSVNATPIKHI